MAGLADRLAESDVSATGSSRAWGSTGGRCDCDMRTGTAQPAHTPQPSQSAAWS